MRHLLKICVCAALFSASCLCTGAYAAPTPSPSPEAAVTAAPTGEPEDLTAPVQTGEPEDLTEPVQTGEPEESAAPLQTDAPDASAAPTGTPAPTTDPLRISNTLDLNILVHQRKYILDSELTIEIYDKDANLLGTAGTPISQKSEWVTLHYDLPDYELGEVFTVKLVDGIEKLQYYDTIIGKDGSFNVSTGLDYDESGAPVQRNSFIFDATPLWDEAVTLHIDGRTFSPTPRARLVEEMTLVPVRTVAEAMGIDVRYDPDYDSIVCSAGNKMIIYNIGTTYATFFGEDLYLPIEPRYYEGSVYVPLRSLAEAFEAPLDVKETADGLDITIGESKLVLEAAPVNQWNISSSTDYMVWVSKSEYTVRVYHGSKNKWRLIYTAPCAIGAPDTPTITGSFEYIERTFWDYGSYYVGPVLRFYNGYALHSTLLYYGGGEYDGRVGVKISHGCVRMKEPDINWIADTIPLYTRIYITE